MTTIALRIVKKSKRCCVGLAKISVRRSSSQPVFTGQSFTDYKFSRTQGAINFLTRMFNPLKEYVARTHFEGSFDNKKALDAGCGFGIDSLEFGREWTHAKILGIDVSREGVRAAEEVYKNMTTEGEAAIGSEAQFEVMDIMNLPEHKDRLGTFDLIFANSVLHFAADEAVLSKMMAGIASVSRPGTVFFGTHAGNINFEDSHFAMHHPVWWEEMPLAVQPPPDGRHAFEDGETVHLVTALHNDVPLHNNWMTLRATTDRIFYFPFTNFLDETLKRSFRENGFDIELFRVDKVPEGMEPVQMTDKERFTANCMSFFIAVYRGNCS